MNRIISLVVPALAFLLGLAVNTAFADPPVPVPVSAAPCPPCVCVPGTVPAPDPAAIQKAIDAIQKAEQPVEKK